MLVGTTRAITTHSAEETTAFGRTLTDLLAPPKLVLLRGDLGAGKTTLIKGIAAAFEAAAEEDVTSPTFTLVHEYRGPRANLYHIDLYRLDTLAQIEAIGVALVAHRIADGNGTGVPGRLGWLCQVAHGLDVGVGSGVILESQNHAEVAGFSGRDKGIVRLSRDSERGCTLIPCRRDPRDTGRPE
jgi:tRNA threonylcarbamoyl adenosine modification protein YjeE